MYSATHALSRRLATSEYRTLSTKYYIYKLLWNSPFELNDEWPFVRWPFVRDNIIVTLSVKAQTPVVWFVAQTVRFAACCTICCGFIVQHIVQQQIELREFGTERRDGVWEVNIRRLRKRGRMLSEYMKSSVLSCQNTLVRNKCRRKITGNCWSENSS